MKIDATLFNESLVATQPKSTENSDQGAGFQDVFKELWDASQEASAASKENTALLLTGQLDNLIDLKVSGEKSGLLFQLNLTTRNKVLDAYSEIMKLQL